jgi:hypothetical protein
MRHEAFAELRSAIRKAERQYRHNNDNSFNDNSFAIFHPAQGFVHAYDREVVERALDRFERQPTSKYQRAPRVVELT